MMYLTLVRDHCYRNNIFSLVSDDFAIVINFLIFEVVLLTIVLFFTLASDISYSYFVFTNVSDVFNL
jgi:hypothetical protein